MTANIPFNWATTTNAPGTFNAQSAGYVAGNFLDDPSSRFYLAGGTVGPNETIPMWGGLAINETTVPNATGQPVAQSGGIITRATNVTAGAAGQITGFTVFNQAYGMTITPQSPVPLAGSGMQVLFMRLGSNMRIVVPCAANLTALAQGSVRQQVSWDFVNQQLINYIPAYATQAVSSATYASTTGIIALTFASAPFGAGIGSGANGAYISVSGLAGTGVAPLNGDWPITGTASAGTVVSVQGPIGLGALTITSSTGNLAAGGGALPCQLLDVAAGNSMVPVYNSTTGFVTWNYSGNVAVILLSN